MKLAVISDIHGNEAALQAVTADIQQWRADQIIVNGDTINRGPASAACWQFIAEQGWLHLKGNHEAYVAERLEGFVYPNPLTDELLSLSKWTAQQLTAVTATQLQQLPTQHTMKDGRFCHATANSLTNGIHAQLPEALIRQRIAPPPALFCTAHTHKPFIRQVEQTLLVNCGSVGQPCDGNLDAGYAQLWHQNGRWHATIRRVSYDREHTNRSFQASGFLAENNQLVWLIYHEWRLGQDIFIPWRKKYFTAVEAGEIALETAVVQHLQTLGLSPTFHPHSST